MVAALGDLEADTCPGCGLPYSETIKATEEDRKRLDDNLTAYWANHPADNFLAGYVVCRGCQAKGYMQRVQRQKDEAAEKAGQKIIPEARLWTVYQRPKPN